MKKGTSCVHAVEMIPDGATLMIGGFIGIGSPHRVIDELVRQGRKNLTVIANDSARPGFGTGKLFLPKLDVRWGVLRRLGRAHALAKLAQEIINRIKVQ